MRPVLRLLRHPVFLLSLGFALLAALALLPKQWHATPIWFSVGLHTLLETVSVACAALVFAVTWHSQRRDRPLELLVFGCALFAVAVLDLAHLLSYEGMPAFVTPSSANKAINFSVISRLVLASVLLFVALAPWRSASRRQPRKALLATTLAAVGLFAYLGFAYPEHWPAGFVEGDGPTPFKLSMDALLAVLAVLAAIGFWRARRRQAPYDAEALLAAAVLSLLTSLCFMLTEHLNGPYGLLGHLFKIASYGFIYQTVFVGSVREPYRRLAVEVAERLAAQRQVEQISFYDALTGLPNLELLRERARQALASAEHEGRHVALLFLDVDQFKLINDSFGRVRGDRLLRRLGEVLAEVLPSSATLCRAGGDEFVLLLPDLVDAERAAQVPEQILSWLRQPLLFEEQEFLVSVSIGMALSPYDGNDASSLLHHAELAMYTAKQAGRRTWRYYDPGMNAEVSAKLARLNGLRLALERQELELHYQVQVDLATHGIVGAEALLRWRHPVDGLVPPGEFIGLAEESGLIVPIGNWVLKEACRQAAAWQAQGLDIPTVAVNIAALQLQQDSFEDQVLGALHAADLAPGRLELELTESGLIGDTEQVLATIRRLKKLGVRLAIDDFGTGYSSLAYLQRLAVDTLKIDQSFVRCLNAGEEGAPIVAAIVQMARSLGLDTLAEGVEDAATARRLRELGCGYAQGYLFARPLPAAEVARLSATWKLAERIDD